MTTLALPQEVWNQEIKEKTEPAADWLWQGFVARGNTCSPGGFLAACYFSARKRRGLDWRMK